MAEVHFWENAPRTVKLNNGEEKTFVYSSKDTLGKEIVKYILEKKKQLGRKRNFSSKELLTAPWMPTQSVILHQTWFHSLQELADQVNNARV